MTGAANTRLVVLRGNSASGKSTVARLLQQRLGRGTALVQQDHLRRVVLREHDRPDLPNIGLIDVVVRHALDSGYHVVLDGTFFTPHYGDMLRRLTVDHIGVTKHYWFDIPLEVTQQRHVTKAYTVPAEQLAEWFNPLDLLGVAGESMIRAEESAVDAVTRVVREVGFPDPPVTAAHPPEAFLDPPGVRTDSATDTVAGGRPVGEPAAPR